MDNCYLISRWLMSLTLESHKSRCMLLCINQTSLQDSWTRKTMMQHEPSWAKTDSFPLEGEGIGIPYFISRHETRISCIFQDRAWKSPVLFEDEESEFIVYYLRGNKRWIIKSTRWIINLWGNKRVEAVLHLVQQESCWCHGSVTTAS